MNFIYITTNIVNNKQYVGSHDGNETDDYLGSGKLFLKSVAKYGKHNFRREILEICEPSQNLSLEEKYIKEFNTLYPNGYNISPTGGHGLRGRLSTITIEKIRNSNTGLKRSDATKKAISLAKKGSTHTVKPWKSYFIEKFGEEQGEIEYNRYLDNQREKHIGKTHSVDVKDKIRISHLEHWKNNVHHNLGKTQDPLHVEKRMKSIRGQIRSDETKRNISSSLKGKHKKHDVWNKGKTTLDIDEQVITDVKQLKSNGLLNKEIAIQLNFSASCISRILNGFYDDKVIKGEK